MSFREQLLGNDDICAVGLTRGVADICRRAGRKGKKSVRAPVSAHRRMNASRTFRTWSNALGWERSVRPRQEPAKELFCALSKFGRRRGQSGLKTAGDLVVIIGLRPLQRTDARETVGLGSVNPCVSMNPHFSRPPNLLRTGLMSAVWNGEFPFSVRVLANEPYRQQEKW